MARRAMLWVLFTQQYRGGPWIPAGVGATRKEMRDEIPRRWRGNRYYIRAYVPRASR